MSNLLKGYFVSVNEDSKMVDNSALVELRLKEEEERRKRLMAVLAGEGETNESEGEFQEGLNFETLDALTLDQGADNPTENANTVIKSQTVSQKSEAQSRLDEINEEIANKEAYILDLNSQAAGIIENARAEAEELKKQGYEEGRNSGYEEGYTKGMEEVEAIKAQIMEEAEAMEIDYQQKLVELEPKFVETITDIYENIFRIDLSMFKGVVSSLVIDAINHSHGARNIMIHISRNDYGGVLEKKEFILTETGMLENNVEFIQDATLSDNQCMIETENGVFDCSLDTELEELKKRLRMLSYTS